MRGAEAQLFEFDLQKRERERELEYELKQIQLENITADSKILKSKVAETQAERDLLSIENARQQFQQDQLKAFQEQLGDLNTEIAIEEAITEERKEQLRLEREIQKVRGNDNLTDDQKDQLEDRLRALDKARKSNQGVSGYMKQLQEELMETEEMIVSLAQTVETQFASAMSSAITGLIDGTTKIEDALGDMFKAIGKAFIDMANQIIAKQLVMIALQSILKALGGGSFRMSSGSTGNFATPDAAGFNAWAEKFQRDIQRAALPVPTASPGWRERPELVQAGPTGMTVTNNEDTKSAMQRFSPANEEGVAAGQISVDVETTTINGMEFITPEQFKKGVEEAAMKGGKMGEANEPPASITINQTKGRV